MANAAAGKAALAVAGIIGVAAVAGPWLIGLRIESAFRDSVAAISAQSPYPIRISRYRRGLYSSEAETIVEIALPPKPDSAEPVPPKQLQVRLLHAISHGPRFDRLLRSGRMTTTPEFDGDIAVRLKPLLGGAPLFTLVTDIGYGGSVSGSLHSPAIDTSKAAADASSKLQLQWAGIESSYSLSGGHLLLRLDAPGLTMSGERQASAVIGPMLLSADMTRIDDGPLWIGTSTAAIDSMTFKAEDGSFVLKQFAINSDSQAIDGLMNSGVQFSAAGLEVGGSQFDKLHLKLAFDRLDATATTEMSLALNRYQQSHGQDGSADPAAMMAELKPALGRLAAGHPEFRVDELSFSGPEGALKVDAAIRYTGDENLDDFSPLTDVEGRAQLDAPLAYVDLLLRQKIRADLAESAGVPLNEVPAEVIGNALASTRAGLVAQGLLMVDAGGRASSQLAFEGGALRVNGKMLGDGATTP